jgi:hypothetical protein
MTISCIPGLGLDVSSTPCRETWRGRRVSGPAPPTFHPQMREVPGLWLHDIESLEAISQDDDTRQIFLRMAALSQTGRLGSFLHELARDEDLDDATKGTLTEIAKDEAFLLAVDDYLLRTQRVH